MRYSKVINLLLRGGLLALLFLLLGAPGGGGGGGGYGGGGDVGSGISGSGNASYGGSATLGPQNVELGLTMVALICIAVGVLVARQSRRKSVGELAESGAPIYELTCTLFLLNNGDTYAAKLGQWLSPRNYTDSAGRSAALCAIADEIKAEDVRLCTRHRVKRSENPAALVSTCKRLFETENDVSDCGISLTYCAATADPAVPDPSEIRLRGPSTCHLGIVTIAPAFSPKVDPNEPQNAIDCLQRTADEMNADDTYLYYWFQPERTTYLSVADGKRMYDASLKTTADFQKSW